MSFDYLIEANWGQSISGIVCCWKLPDHMVSATQAPPNVTHGKRWASSLLCSPQSFRQISAFEQAQSKHLLVSFDISDKSRQLQNRSWCELTLTAMIKFLSLHPTRAHPIPFGPEWSLESSSRALPLCDTLIPAGVLVVTRNTFLQLLVFVVSYAGLYEDSLHSCTHCQYLAVHFFNSKRSIPMDILNIDRDLNRWKHLTTEHSGNKSPALTVSEAEQDG